MSELKATPGEWRWEDHENDGQWLVSEEDGFGWIILETDDVKPEDASLIAAAKELYAAAELALRVLPIAGESDKQDEARLVLRSALSKARGEQQ